VLVLIGVNDQWTRPIEIDLERPLAGRSFWKRTRTYRIYLILRRSYAPRDLDVTIGEVSGTGRSGTARFGEERFELSYERGEFLELIGSDARLKANLTSLAKQAAAFDAQLVLLTYPTRRPNYAVANRVIRLVARLTGTPLVDLAEHFSPYCPEEDCPDYLFADHHPRARGYRVVAETLFEQLLRLGFLVR